MKAIIPATNEDMCCGRMGTSSDCILNCDSMSVEESRQHNKHLKTGSFLLLMLLPLGPVIREDVEEHTGRVIHAQWW